MSKPGSTTVIEAHSVHRDIRGEHPSFVFTHAGDIAFALRTSLAGLAALYAALWLELDTPQWAIWTVFIVSPPVRGNALRKTVARLVGTVVGSIAAIVFVGVFPQQPAGFYILLAAWLGTCAYWGTLRRGYVSYAATLAAFTSAIVSAGVSVNPLSVWQTASDRTAATVIGVLFALLASDIAARGDDAPGELAKRVRGLAADLLDWAAGQLQLGQSDEAMDAPLTAKILALDETCINAIAERPALIRVRSWIGGIPTALLSLQSAVLCLRDSSRRGGAATPDARPGTDAIDGVAVFLRGESAVDLPSLRRQRASLAAFRQAPW
ncbi:MAG: FUSC family protein, partial [Tepidisphaeraceae bacterium]